MVLARGVTGPHSTVGLVELTSRAGLGLGCLRVPWLLTRPLRAPECWVAQGLLCPGLSFVAFLMSAAFGAWSIHEPHYTLAQRMRRSKWLIKHLLKG